MAESLIEGSEASKDGRSLLTWQRLKQFVLQYLQFVSVYSVVVAGGVFLALTLSSAAGYLPYSDRPGPGWYGAHFPRWGEIGYYTNFAAIFVVPFCFIWGTVLFLFARCLGALRAPGWFVACIGGVGAGYLSLFGVAAAGWYIAVASFPVYCAGALGLVFGSIVLPRYAKLSAHANRNWLNWCGIIVTVAAFAYLAVLPLLPASNAQSLEVDVMRLANGPEPIGTDEDWRGLSGDQLALLKSLGLSGAFHGGTQSLISIGSEGPQAKATLIVTEPLSSSVELRQPKATTVLYVQIGDKWKMFSPDAPTIRRKIKLSPSNEGPNKLDLVIEPGHHPLTFSWYPPMQTR